MSEAHKGALISPELSALVHWTIGRATTSEPDDAVQIGMGLIDEIQKELNAKFRSGVSAVRRTQVNGGDGDSTSSAQSRGGAFGYGTLSVDRVGYSDGAVV